MSAVEGSETLMTLADLLTGEEGIIQAIETDAPLLQRLQELGLLPGTRIQARFSSRSGDPVAYKVRGTVLALRLSTARSVIVYPMGGSLSCPKRT